MPCRKHQLANAKTDTTATVFRAFYVRLAKTVAQLSKIPAQERSLTQLLGAFVYPELASKSQYPQILTKLNASRARYVMRMLQRAESVINVRAAVPLLVNATLDTTGMG